MSNYMRSIIAVMLLMLIVFGFIFVLGDTFQSLLIAFILAYFLFPFITKLESFGIPRAIITILLILFITGVVITALYFAIPVIIYDVKKLIILLPEKVSLLLNLLIEWGNRVGFDLESVLRKYSDQQEIFHWIENNLSQFSNMVLIPLLKISGFGLIGLRTGVLSLINLFIIPVFFFFLVNSYEKITSEMAELLPLKQRTLVGNYLEQLNFVLSGYLRGQIGLSLLVSCYYAASLTLIGVRLGPLIGLVTGIINMIPYVGITISVILTCLSVAFYSQNIAFDLFLVAAVYGLEITVEMLYLYPRFVGTKIGLKPLEIMLALAAGVNVGGVMGALLGVPLAAVIKVMLRDAIQYYKRTEIFQNQL